MSYNILNKNVNFQGATKGTVEDLMDTHSDQSITGSKDFLSLTASVGRISTSLTTVSLTASATANITGQITAGSISLGDATGIAGNGLDNNSGTLVLDLTEVGFGGGANRLVTDDGDGTVTTETNLTFDTDAGGSTLTVNGLISGSGNISGSAFFGAGTGLSGIPASAITLASNSGLANSGGLIVKPSEATSKGSVASNDIIIISDSADSNNTKTVTAGQVAALSSPEDWCSNLSDDRLITGAGADTLQAEQFLTFNSSRVLTLGQNPTTNTGQIVLHGTLSGSGNISGSIFYGHGIELGDATGLAGNGLGNASGQLDIQVSGALKLTSDKLGISGSFAGNGLAYSGSVDAIGGVSIELDSNSGLAVGASGLKTSFASLASATPAVASDSLAFIDSDGDKKCSFETFLTQIAGSGLGVLNSQLTSSGGGAVTAVANGADNRIATFSSSDELNGEANLTFDGDQLIVNNTGSFNRIRTNYTGAGFTSTRLLVSGSSSELLFHVRQQGNSDPVLFLSGEDYSPANLSNVLYTTANITSTGTGSFLIVGAGTLDGLGDVQTGYYNASGSNTDVYLQFNEQGNTNPLFAVAGTNHPTVPGQVKTLCTFSSSAGVQAVGNTVLGGTLSVTGSSTFAGNVSSSLGVTGSTLYTVDKTLNSTPTLLQHTVGNSGSVMALKYREELMACGTDNNFDEIPNFLQQNIVPVALGIRVVQGMGNNAYISKIGTINDDDAFGVFNDNVLETGGDTAVTAYAPGAGTGQSAYWYTQNTELRVSYNATPASGSIRFGLYYYEISPPSA